MTDKAPERIWIKEGHDSWGQYGHWYRDNDGCGTEYVRADRIDELERHLENCIWELRREEARMPHRHRVASLAEKALNAKSPASGD